MRERNTVNVYHTGEMLSFGCAMTIFSTLTLMQAVYGYPVDESLLLTVKKKKLLLIIYCLKQNEKKHFVVLCMASICFLLVSEWKLLLSSTTEIYDVSKWCTLWECLLCAVTHCRILCMESVKASKHVTGILF